MLKSDDAVSSLDIIAFIRVKLMVSFYKVTKLLDANNVYVAFTMDSHCLYLLFLFILLGVP
jgi:hypothetical protein